MKQYNEILEAVHRGIQLALDDYEDNEQTSKRLGNYKGHITTPEALKIIDKTVDLGLPSGTLWCKYNLGVDYTSKHKMSHYKNWRGDVYCWGEIKARPNENTAHWNTYRFAGADGYAHLTKYCTDSNYGFVGHFDNLTQLQPEDDIATLLLGPGFHIPTKNECEELISYTTNRWEDDYKKIKNLAGRVFTSKINGEEVFFPKNNDTSDMSYYWSSDISELYPYRAYAFVQSKLYGMPDLKANSRVDPLLIRPVYS